MRLSCHFSPHALLLASPCPAPLPPSPPALQVIRSLRRGGLFEKVAQEHVLASVADAVAYAEAQDALPSDKASTPTEGRSSSDEEGLAAAASKSFKSSASQLAAM